MRVFAPSPGRQPGPSCPSWLHARWTATSESAQPRSASHCDTVHASRRTDDVPGNPPWAQPGGLTLRSPTATTAVAVLFATHVTQADFARQLSAAVDHPHDDSQDAADAASAYQRLRED